jgi:pimeloyl-ACP methyl ester carboxylesterase
MGLLRRSPRNSLLQSQRTLSLGFLLGCILTAAIAFAPTAVPSSRGTIGRTSPPLRNPFFATLKVASAAIEDSETAPAAAPMVQRNYETFLWKHELNDYNINYRVEGPIMGTPILLVHGFGANVNHFRFQFPALVQAGYRVYAVDLLGFGASDKPKDANYSIELFVTLLRDFIHTMHSDRQWFVAGNSIGGLCALSVAEQSPDAVQGVVLFNCAGGMSGFRYEDVPIFVRPILYIVQKVVLGPKMGGDFFKNFKSRENVESILRTQGVYSDQTRVDDELLEILLGPADDEGAEQVFLKVFAGPPGPTPESMLPTVRAPILALWGSADPWTPVDKGAHPGTKFGDYNDDFTLEILPGAGHCPHDECPDEIHAKMLPWMEMVGSRGGDNNDGNEQ